MNCFLHIGTEKTGSTAIQNFLDSNRDKLVQAGYIFTKSLGARNNIKISMAAYNADRRDDITRRRGICSDEQLIELQQKIKYQFTNEVEGLKLSNKVKNLIISSEHIHSRLTDDRELERLRGILKDVGVKSFQVVVYLRNPADLAQSLYSTAIKHGSTCSAPPPPDDPYYHNACNHRKTLERYAAVFGGQAIIPRIFERLALTGEDIVSDFLDTLSVDLKTQINKRGPNQSLSDLGVKLLRHVNFHLPVFEANQLNPMRGNVTDFFEGYLGGPPYQMPDELRRQYDYAFANSNEWVRQNYFPYREKLFSPGVIENPDQKSVLPDDEASEIAQLLVKIWEEKMESNNAQAEKKQKFFRDHSLVRFLSKHTFGKDEI